MVLSRSVVVGRSHHRYHDANDRKVRNRPQGLSTGIQSCRAVVRESTAVPRLDVSLNRLHLKNPILVASGTFGYAREMVAYADFAKLGGIIPKTVTPLPRPGNPPPRTVETSSGLLNSIGLDNDGLDAFIAKHLQGLLGMGTAIIAGATPMRTSVNANDVADETTTRSHDAISPTPPARTAP